jgi:hypothetical protein
MTNTKQRLTYYFADGQDHAKQVVSRPWFDTIALANGEVALLGAGSEDFGNHERVIEGTDINCTPKGGTFCNLTVVADSDITLRPALGHDKLYVLEADTPFFYGGELGQLVIENDSGGAADVKVSCEVLGKPGSAEGNNLRFGTDNEDYISLRFTLTPADFDTEDTINFFLDFGGRKELVGVNLYSTTVPVVTAGTANLNINLTNNGTELGSALNTVVNTTALITNTLTPATLSATPDNLTGGSARVSVAVSNDAGTAGDIYVELILVDA